MTDSDAPIDRQALLAIFWDTTEETLGEVEEALVSLEAAPSDAELLKTALRGLHTIKGNASSIDLEELTHFTHVLEEPLVRVREGALRLTPPIVSFLLHGLDTVRELVGESREAERAEAGAPSSGAGGAPSARARGYAGVRVAPDRLDRMLTLVGELAITRAQIEERMRRRTQDGLEEAIARYRDSERLHVELEEIVMKLGMIPLEPVLRQYARALHDAASLCEKRARLVVEARDVELDGAMVDQLRDPLLHMVRNAVDHGIERPEVRLARGKSDEGRVTLRAYHDAGSVVVEVEDDGAGLDRDRILAQARARGIAGDAEPRDADVYRLVLEPGFSTADAVTDLSGRGVGMDVVARAVSALRGRIDIDSRPGGGATFAIRLPLTLAIIDGFEVGAAGETFIIPSGAVDEFVDVRRMDAAAASGGVLRWRGSAVPLLPLARLFSLRDDAPRPSSSEVVVVHHAGGRAALVVDAIHGSSRAVIKPLRGLARVADGIAGSTIVGSGRVAFVLDVPSILKRAGARALASASRVGTA